VVDLNPFWRKRRLNEADKHLIVGPLLNSAHLLVLKKVPDQGFGGLMEELADKWAANVLLPLTQKVVLNPQTYYRMLHEGLAGHTVIEQLRVHAPHYEQHIEASDSSQVTAFFQGDRGRQDADVRQTGLTPDDLEAIAAKLAVALRNDAQHIDRVEVRETILELANAAETARNEPDKGRVTTVLMRARDALRIFGTGMEETRKVVDQFGHILDHLWRGPMPGRASYAESPAAKIWDAIAPPHR
jgi:hypothetical protein